MTRDQQIQGMRNRVLICRLYSHLCYLDELSGSSASFKIYRVDRQNMDNEEDAADEKNKWSIPPRSCGIVVDCLTRFRLRTGSREILC